MAKIYLKRLQKKFKFKEDEITGLNYRKLIKDIIDSNSRNIARSTARISRENYDRQIKEFIKRRERAPEKKLVLPDVSEVLPKKSIFLRKAAQDGNLLTDTLRDRLTKNLRESLEDFKSRTGEPAFVRRRGEFAGTINPKVIDLFEKRIKGTFENYTKEDPRIGMPNNIRQIAITEIRSTVDTIKHSYNLKLAKDNKDLVEIFKIWRQNKNLSKEPRVSHDKINGKRLPINEAYNVGIEKTRGGKSIIIGFESMQHPHDANASAENVIGCSCELEYVVVWKT